MSVVRGGHPSGQGAAAGGRPQSRRSEPRGQGGQGGQGSFYPSHEETGREREESKKRETIGGHPDHLDRLSKAVPGGQGESLNPKVKVRRSGSHQTALQSDFDPVPCAMRLTMPGTRRLQNPVQGRRDGVNKNEDVLVWCDCMAQTAEQHKIALEVVERGLDPDDVAWPTPKHQRGWDVLGAVSVRDDDRVTEAVRMWKEHVAKRRALIESRSAK